MLKNVKDTETRQPAIRVVLLPRDTNAHGTIFGGIILSYIDLAGGIEAAKHTDNRLVTASLEEVAFKQPVYVGEVVSFYTRTIRIGTSSIKVHVDVEVERKEVTVSVTHADMTFVSVDKDGRPTPVK